MCCHIINKAAYPEPEKPAAEAVESATVAEKDKKKPNDGDNVRLSGSSGSVEVVQEKKGNESYSHTLAESEDEEEVYNEPPKKTDHGGRGFGMESNHKSHRPRPKTI